MIEALLQAERLLLHGLVDQAERIYAGAFEQDPLNAIAVVGLARVALERGDDRLAYERARQALEIDPQNAAAVRLEARLAEVFAARNEPSRAPSAPVHAPPAAAPTPAPDARPSESIAFTRNPSMAEHQRMEQLRDTPAPPLPSTPDQATEAQSSERRTGLFRRLLGE